MPGEYFMAISVVIFGTFFLAIITAIAGFLTRQKLLYVAALILGGLAVVMGIFIALALPRM